MSVQTRAYHVCKAHAHQQEEVALQKINRARHPRLNMIIIKHNSETLSQKSSNSLFTLSMLKLSKTLYRFVKDFTLLSNCDLSLFPTSRCWYLPKSQGMYGTSLPLFLTYSQLRFEKNLCTLISRKVIRKFGSNLKISLSNERVVESKLLSLKNLISPETIYSFTFIQFYTCSNGNYLKVS